MGILRLYVSERQRSTVKKFKKICALREVSMSAAVLAFMEREIAEAREKV